MLDSILPTPVKLTHSEILFSAAATLAFQVIEKGGRPIIRLSRLCEKPQYGYTASSQAEGVGPRFLRITDIKAGSVIWKNVPYCDCPEPEKYLLKPGDILVARSGSVGKSFLVSECPEPTVFASYMIRMRAKPGVLAGYVYWYLQTQQFWFQIKESKRGSAMKNINSKMLSSARIPDATPSQQRAVVSFLTWFQNRIDGDCKTPPPEVPELLDVPRIVARVEELAALIEEAQGLRVKAREEAAAFVTSLHLKLAQERIVGLDEILELDECREVVQPGRKYPQIGIKGFGQGLFVREELDATQTSYKAFNRLYEGAVVLSQPKGWEGAIAVCPAELAGRYASPEYRTFRCISDKAIPEYLAAVFATPWFWTRLKNLSRGIGARRQRTRPEQFLAMEVPMPTVDQQKQAISIFGDLHELTALQDATQPELDALLPSVLDRVFRGEL